MIATPIKSSDVQIIKQGGKPAFVVVPYQSWLAMTKSEEKQRDKYIPHEVVELQIIKGLSPIAAWRKYKKITQKDLAKTIGVTQAALSQIEKSESAPQKRTLNKIAKALGVSVEQLY